MATNGIAKEWLQGPCAGGQATCSTRHTAVVLSEAKNLHLLEAESGCSTHARAGKLLVAPGVMPETKAREPCRRVSPVIWLPLLLLYSPFAVRGVNTHGLLLGGRLHERHRLNRRGREVQPADSWSLQRLSGSNGA
jgi:hypothetical protein